MAETTINTRTNKNRCKCGNPARAGQRTCLTCHARKQQESRERIRKRYQILDLVLSRLSPGHPATQQAFEARFKDRFVVYLPGPDQGECEFAGCVIGFKPEEVITVMDVDGVVHDVPLARLYPDRTCSQRTNWK